MAEASRFPSRWLSRHLRAMVELQRVRWRHEYPDQAYELVDTGNWRYNDQILHI